jgi:rhodanese-related sulfurtransferase
MDALNLNDEEFNTQFNRKKPAKNDEVIFSCLVGGRAQKGATVAVGLGFEKY